MEERERERGNPQVACRIHFLNGWSALGIGQPQSPGSKHTTWDRVEREGRERGIHELHAGSTS